MNREAERKRLVELVQSAPYGLGTLGEYFNKSYIENCIVQHLLANGIVVPPVKVGQTVWEVVSWDKNVRECRVSSLTQKADGTFKIRLTNLKSKSVYERVPQHIGDIIFLTREEAEKMLNGKEDEGK